MTKRFQSRMLRQLAMKSLAARVLGLALFVWTTVYNPLHLVLEQHSEDLGSETAPAHQAAISAGDLDHGHDNHQIHAASDHKLRAACQSQTLAPTSPVFVSILELLEAPSPCFVQLFLVERVNPPGLELSETLLPRAPPIS